MHGHPRAPRDRAPGDIDQVEGKRAAENGTPGHVAASRTPSRFEDLAYLLGRRMPVPSVVLLVFRRVLKKLERA